MSRSIRACRSYRAHFDTAPKAPEGAPGLWVRNPQRVALLANVGITKPLASPSVG